MDQPSVPIVRVVVGALQFAVAGAAILAVMCAALGLKPGGSRLLLVVRTHVCMCVCAYVHCSGARPAYCAFSCLLRGFACH